MAEHTSTSFVEAAPKPKRAQDSFGPRLVGLPWLFIGIVVVVLWAGVGILTSPNFNEAFQWIKVGIATTLVTSIIAYVLAIVLGLLTGLGRMSHSVVIRNVARMYVELIRGIPMLVLIFFIAFVGVPAGLDLLHALGVWFSSIGLSGLGNLFSSLENQAVPMLARAILALPRT